MKVQVTLTLADLTAAVAKHVAGAFTYDGVVFTVNESGETEATLQNAEFQAAPIHAPVEAPKAKPRTRRSPQQIKADAAALKEVTAPTTGTGVEAVVAPVNADSVPSTATAADTTVDTHPTFDPAQMLHTDNEAVPTADAEPSEDTRTEAEKQFDPSAVDAERPTRLLFPQTP